MTTDPFALAAATLHADPAGGIAATYTPLVGSAVACTVVLRPLDAPPDALFGEVGARRPLWEVQILQSEWTLRPVRGDQVTTATATLEVRTVEEDPHGLRWLVRAQPTAETDPVGATAAFLLGAETLHGAPAGTDLGTYTPSGGGSTTTVHALWRWNDEAMADGLGERRVQRRGAVAWLLEAEVPARPADGATIAFDTVTLRIRQAYRLDGGRWQLDCDEAASTSAAAYGWFTLPQVWQPIEAL